MWCVMKPVRYPLFAPVHLIRYRPASDVCEQLFSVSTMSSTLLDTTRSMKPVSVLLIAIVFVHDVLSSTAGNRPALSSETARRADEVDKGKQEEYSMSNTGDPALHITHLVIERERHHRHSLINRTASIQACAKLNIDASIFKKGKACGSPSSPPCFTYDRCVPPPNGKGATIYVHDYSCSLADSDQQPMTRENQEDHHISSYWREAAKEAGVLAETYESACIFIHANDGPGSREELCATNTPLWNDGVNHVMVDFTDASRNQRRDVAMSYALEAASNMHTCFYRSGYDLSLPLFPKRDFSGFAKISPMDRQHFLTFKGTLYLAGSGKEERRSLTALHNEGNNTIISLECFTLHGEDRFPENVDYCDELTATYDDFSYGNLMNTTFGLVPSGRSPGTYRLAEVMGAGAIPVFVTWDMVPPFPEMFDWPSFSFTFRPDQVGPGMLETLRAVSPEELTHMQHKALEASWKMFKGTTRSYENIARMVVNEVERRVIRDLD